MKNLFPLLLSVFLFNNVSGQDKTIDLSSYTSIAASAGIEVELVPGSPKAEITIKKGEIDDVEIKQSGNSVSVGFKSQGWMGTKSKNRKAYVKLYYDKDISKVDVSSGASVNCNETMKVNTFRSQVSSGGSVTMMIDSENTDVDVSSGGSLKLEGESDKLSVDVSSGGSFSGGELKSDNVDADASSGGSAKVWAVKEIDAGASSGGSVKYKGDPEKEDIDVGKWSGGSVRKM
jgi:hypothetical protein